MSSLLRQTIDDLYRTESRRVFATLVRLVRDFDLAEEVMHIAWTHELFRDIGRCCCQGLILLSQGLKPTQGIVNPEVLDHPVFQVKWQRLIDSPEGDRK